VGAADNMTRVKLIDFIFNYGIYVIGVASASLYCSSLLLGAGDAKMVRSAASIGILTYIGCWLAKYEYNKDKKDMA
jgi:hypothetical protein